MDDTADVRRIVEGLGLPGIIDVHTHFMPKNVMDKVWQYFDSAGPLTGRSWPITYRADEQDRLSTLRSFGVQAFTSLVYPHKPDMAEWLNQWAARFAADTPDCLSTATFFPEPGAARYAAAALDRGARVFKAHVQVGGYDPTDALLDDVWGVLADSGTPVVTHCGSGPTPGAHTGPGPIRAVLARHPRLRLIVAHMGAPEYSDFLDIAAAHDGVYLDTTMAFTPFMERTMPFPATEYPRLRDLGHRILWGSDFPNIPYTYAEAMRAVRDLPGVDDGWLRGVFYRNAAAVFGAPEPD
ncbi:MAG: amidohydrolase family protein [Mycolicibacterium neoaurum]|uniref:amidohydrolase family protein n=1 Tax=Mycolicibacterium neoaurum TaxID=1795 RepID=UPI002FF8664E